MDEIAQVYARSLFQVAKEMGLLDVIKEQLGQFTQALNDNRQMAIFLFSPYFSTDEKKAGLERAVSGAEPIFFNFLEALLERHRMPVIFRIRSAYDQMWEDENKLLPVQVTSAVELDEQTIKTIGDQIGEQTGRKIELSSEVDDGIIGGIVLRVGNVILDASIRNRLEQLRKQVAHAA
ncbi:MAG TPA: ATP synthase F1 subunit delta [Solirubrobacteraceae bacterium]|jgi:ATP synthase F1 delta subunit|nr:ATP synthase F1 subunit delta [Solirubrobacteraceae bacterium]